MSEPILKVERSNRFFRALHVTSGVSFEVPDGQTRAVIGPNDAGRNTLVGLICSRMTPSSGKVISCGEDIMGSAPHKIIREGMCKCSQITQIFSNLTVCENVQTARISMNKKAFHFLPVKDTYLRDEVMKYLAMAGIEDKAEEITGSVSYGDQRRLDTTIALALKPRLLTLDEPATGVARGEAHKLMDLTWKLGKEQYMIIVFIEHNMEIVFNRADEISVMSSGALVVSDIPGKVRQNEFVQQAYLGGVE